MLKAHAAESEKRDLLQELAIMKLLDPHPNVVRLLGCCTEKGNNGFEWLKIQIKLYLDNVI